MNEETAVDKDKPGVTAVGGGGEVPTVAAVVHLLRRGDRAEMLR